MDIKRFCIKELELKTCKWLMLHHSHWLIIFTKYVITVFCSVHSRATALYIPFKQDFSLLSTSLFGLNKRAQQWLSVLQWVTLCIFWLLKTLKLWLSLNQNHNLFLLLWDYTNLCNKFVHYASYLLKKLRHLTHQTGVWLHLAFVSVREKEVSQQWCVC